MKKNFIRYIIIFFISIIFTLYFFEFYLLQKEKNLNTLKDQEIKIRKKFDRRSTLEVYTFLKNKENVTVKYLPRLFLNKQNTSLFALSGVSSTKTILCNEDGFMSYYISDRYGFNNPDNEWEKLEKKKNIGEVEGGVGGGDINIIPYSKKKNQRDYNWDVEYVLLGDSFTHGFCVNRPKDIGSVLRKLSKKTVLNLGYGGNGTLLHYATFREYVNFQAKNVLLFYYSNDFEDLNRELKNSILLNYLNNKEFSQNLKRRQNEINLIIKTNITKTFEEEQDKLIHKNKFKKKKNIFYKFLRLDKTKQLLKKSFFYLNYNKKIPFEEFKFIINDLNERTVTSGGNFYFIYLPSVSEYDQSSIILKRSLNDRKKIIFSFLNSQNIRSIDIDREVFKNIKDPLSLFNVSLIHYNEKGYDLIAKAVHRKTRFNMAN